MIDLRLIHVTDFVKTTPVGAFDFEKSKEVFLQLAREPLNRKHHILLDLRQTKKDISYAEVYKLVKEIKAHGDDFPSKMAVLDRYDNEFEQTQFFEASAQYVGLNVRAFVDFEEAFKWLHPETTTL